MGFFLASIGLDDHGLGDKIKVRMFYLVIQIDEFRFRCIGSWNT